MSSNAEHYSAINMDDTQYLVNSNDNFPTAMDSLNGTVGQKINRESGSAYKRYVNDESTGTYGRDVKGGTAITYGGGCVNDNSARTYEGGCVNENSARTYEGEDENGESDNVDAGSGDIDDNEQAKPIEPVESSNESSYAPADFQ
jgi:hypothetical protein